MRYTRIIAFLLSCGNVFHVTPHIAHEETVSFNLAKQYNNKRVLASFECLKAGSAMDCFSECVRDHNCNFVSYHSNQNVCEKSNMTTVANLTDEAPWISIWRLGHIGEGLCILINIMFCYGILFSLLYDTGFHYFLFDLLHVSTFASRS